MTHPRRGRASMQSGRDQHQSRHRPAYARRLLRAAEMAAATQGQPAPTSSRDWTMRRCRCVFSRRSCLPHPAGSDRRRRTTSRASRPCTLLEAMREAADRDRIARQYVTDFDEVFWSLGLPALSRRRGRAAADVADRLRSIMAFPRRLPDSHVARKHGADVDGRMGQGRGCRSAVAAAPLPAATMRLAAGAACAFDRRLKARGINPGTSADLTVAIFLSTRLVNHLA